MTELNQLCKECLEKDKNGRKHIEMACPYRKTILKCFWASSTARIFVQFDESEKPNIWVMIP